MNLDKQEIGYRIREARLDAHLSLAGLAPKIIQRNGKPMSAQGLWFIETGKSDASFNYVAQIAKISKKPLTYFTEGGENA